MAYKFDKYDRAWENYVLSMQNTPIHTMVSIFFVWAVSFMEYLVEYHV